MRRLRLALALFAAALAALAVHAALTRWPLPQLLQGTGWAAPAPGSVGVVAWTLALLLPLAWLLAGALDAPLARLLRALEGVVSSYRDGDFSLSLATRRRSDGLATLVDLHNALGEALREQRQHLVERELLLDTLVQNTPVALLLVDEGGRIAFANLAARQLLGEGRSLEGAALAGVLTGAPGALREAVAGGAEGMVAVPMAGEDEHFHVSSRRFRLQGRAHTLHLVRRMTRELSRQEVASWKRVIRVLSHELNNSLAPISSLAHSGAELARRGDTAALDGVFRVIGERARHLHEFLAAYAALAKLPAPRPAAVEWAPFLEGVAAAGGASLAAPLPAQAGWFDAVQVEQALLNLLKNAAEAGGPADAVTLGVAAEGDAWRIDVCDRGPGMGEAVLAQALLPFYSTKRGGTGLGLALAREIAEAHGGRIALANRAGGGVRVSLFLPGRGAPG